MIIDLLATRTGAALILKGRIRALQSVSPSPFEPTDCFQPLIYVEKDVCHRKRSVKDITREAVCRHVSIPNRQQRTCFAQPAAIPDATRSSSKTLAAMSVPSLRLLRPGDPCLRLRHSSCTVRPQLPDSFHTPLPPVSRVSNPSANRSFDSDTFTKLPRTWCEPAIHYCSLQCPVCTRVPCESPNDQEQMRCAFAQVFLSLLKQSNRIQSS